MKNVWLFAFLTLAYTTVIGQVDEGDYVEKKLVRVTKNDGATYVGYLELMDEEKVIIETEKLGRVSIPKHTISNIEYIENSSATTDLKGMSQNLINQDPRNSRYLITGSAIPIKKGTFLANFNLWGPQFTYAASDQFSVGLSTSWLTVPVVINGKYSFNLAKNAHFALGANFGFPSLVNYSASILNPYATLTLGSSSDNVSVSYHYFTGFGQIEGDFGNAIVIGGRKTINKKYALLLDSFIIGNPVSSDAAILLAPGFRYTYSPRSAFQFGLTGVVASSGGEYFTIPIPIPFFSWNLIL